MTRFLAALALPVLVLFGAIGVADAASSYEDCSATGACTDATEVCKPVPNTSGAFQCLSQADSNLSDEDLKKAQIADTYGDECSTDSDCGPHQFCNTQQSNPDVTRSGVGTCDVSDPDDRPSDGAAGTAGGGGAAAGGNAGTGGADNLRSAQSTRFGTNALRGLGLYSGAPETLLITVVRQVFLFIGAILVVMLVAGGIMYMTSAGNQSGLSQAKQIITAAIVGTVIAFAAFLIAEFVIRALTTTA